MVSINLEVKAISEKDLASFIQLCMIIQEAGIRGTGVKIPVYVDGDGSGRFTFQLPDKQLPRIKHLELDNLKTIWLGE